jgi:S-adenosylhomocysteine hydrolase
MSNIDPIELIKALMAPYQPAPENMPAQKLITIVNMNTGEKRQVTEDELDEMKANAVY